MRRGKTDVQRVFASLNTPCPSGHEMTLREIRLVGRDEMGSASKAQSPTRARLEGFAGQDPS